MKSRVSENILVNAKNIFIIVIIFHCINSLFWFKSDGYVQHGCHSVWLEKKSFEYSESVLNDKTSILEKGLKTLDFFKLNRYGYAFSATNFNLTSFFIAFPIAANLDGNIKLFLINAILFSQFLLVLFAIYYLGKIIFNQTTGAWSAIILSFYPGIFGLSRKTNSELLVTFFVILSIIVFIRWKCLPRILRSLLLFAIFGLGIFSGGLFLVFFIPLFLMHLLFIFLYHRRKMESLLELIVFLCLILLFLNFYFNGEYLKVFSNLKEGFNEAYQKLFFQSTNFLGSAGNAIIESFLFAPQDSICPCTQTTNVGMNIKTFSFYIMEMMYYTSPLFFLLAIPSFFFLVRDKRVDFYKRMFFGVWVVFGYLLLSLFHIKWGKFITPILPVLALSSSVFICNCPKKVKIKKPLFFSIGILTILYYSYFSIPHERFLEKLNEGIISHRPLKSRFVGVAEEVATRVNNDDMSKTADVVDIVFLDRESLRFQGIWVTDMSVRIENLIRLFLKDEYRMKNFWRLSDDFYKTLYRRNFIILITQQKVKEFENYLYEEERRGEPSLNFEIIYEDWLRDGIFIYLIRVSKGMIL